MKLRFLCGVHRVRLVEKPDKAINCWQDGFDTGQYFCEQSMWEEALPHVGCAFEAAGIMLTTRAVAVESGCAIFCASALLLIDVFARLGCAEECQAVYWMATERLTRELSLHPGSQANIGAHLEALYSHLQGCEPAASRSAAVPGLIHHQRQMVVH